jgi:hypothetical protein
MSGYLITAGGKIVTLRCQASSKRTRVQCAAPAMRGKVVCRFHGGKSTGAATPEGRVRQLVAITKGRHDSREERDRRRGKYREMKELINLLHSTP